MWLDIQIERQLDRQIGGQEDSWIDKYKDVCIFYREIDAQWRGGMYIQIDSS